MKKYYLLLLSVLALVIVSCAKDDMGDNNIHYSDLGIIESLGDEGVHGYYFRMIRDDGVMLTAVENRSEGYELYVGKRVYCAYEVLRTNYRADGGKECDIAVLGFDNILSKPVLRRSFIEEDYEHRTDSIGNDLIGVIQGRAWLGGGHLNIEFVYQRIGEEKHMINLVWDDTGTEKGVINLYLRHNDGLENYNEGVMQRAAGFVSFLIREPLLLAASNEVTIRLYYNWDGSSNNASEQYLENTFKLDSTSSTPVTIDNIGENIVIAPPDSALYLE